MSLQSSDSEYNYFSLPDPFHHFLSLPSLSLCHSTLSVSLTLIFIPNFYCSISSSAFFSSSASFSSIYSSSYSSISFFNLSSHPFVFSPSFYLTYSSTSFSSSSSSVAYSSSSFSSSCVSSNAPTFSSIPPSLPLPLFLLHLTCALCLRRFLSLRPIWLASQIVLMEPTATGKMLSQENVVCTRAGNKVSQRDMAKFWGFDERTWSLVMVNFNQRKGQLNQKQPSHQATITLQRSAFDKAI